MSQVSPFGYNQPYGGVNTPIPPYPGGPGPGYNPMFSGGYAWNTQVNPYVNNLLHSVNDTQNYIFSSAAYLNGQPNFGQGNNSTAYGLTGGGVNAVAGTMPPEAQQTANLVNSAVSAGLQAAHDATGGTQQASADGGGAQASEGGGSDNGSFGSKLGHGAGGLAAGAGIGFLLGGPPGALIGGAIGAIAGFFFG